MNYVDKEIGYHYVYWYIRSEYWYIRSDWINLCRLGLVSDYVKVQKIKLCGCGDQNRVMD